MFYELFYFSVYYIILCIMDFMYYMIYVSFFWVYIIVIKKICSNWSDYGFISCLYLVYILFN